MQATVLEFDPTTQGGQVILDDGHAVPFTPEAFATSGLRMLRPGQRVRVDLTPDGEIAALTIATLP